MSDTAKTKLVVILSTFN